MVPDKYRFSLTGLVKNSPIDPLAQPYDALMIMAETLEPDRKSAAKDRSIKEYWGFGKVRKPSDITKIAEELLKIPEQLTHPSKAFIKALFVD